jgi:hypothetical protein
MLRGLWRSIDAAHQSDRVRHFVCARYGFTDIFQSFSLQSRNRDGIMLDPG